MQTLEEMIEEDKKKTYESFVKNQFDTLMESIETSTKVLEHMIEGGVPLKFDSKKPTLTT